MFTAPIKKELSCDVPVIGGGVAAARDVDYSALRELLLSQGAYLGE